MHWVYSLRIHKSLMQTFFCYGKLRERELTHAKHLPCSHQFIWVVALNSSINTGMLCSSLFREFRHLHLQRRVVPWMDAELSFPKVLSLSMSVSHWIKKRGLWFVFTTIAFFLSVSRLLHFFGMLFILAELVTSSSCLETNTQTAHSNDKGTTPSLPGCVTYGGVGVGQAQQDCQQNRGLHTPTAFREK